MFVVEPISARQMPEVERDWSALAENAIEPNPFYEPWMLLPAMDILDDKDSFRAALVWRRNPANAKEKPILSGFIPYCLGRRYKRIPVSTANILSHLYCFSGAPLLHKDFAGPALDTYFRWMMSRGSQSKLVRFERLPADGAFHQTLVKVVHARSLFELVERRYTRAVYRCSPPGSESPIVPMSRKALKRLEQQWRKLSQLGAVELRNLRVGDDLTSWTTLFLDLEASGWKGKEGTALLARASHERFFREVTRAAHERGRLSMSALLLNGRAVAARTAFRAGEGSFLFKIAYDEAFAKYSPGNLLELEHLQRGLQNSSLWEDSCASAEDVAAQRLSLHSRPVEDLAVCPGSLYGNFILSVLPLLGFVHAYLIRASNGLRGKAPARDRPGTKPGGPAAEVSNGVGRRLEWP